MLIVHTLQANTAWSFGKVGHLKVSLMDAVAKQAIAIIKVGTLRHSEIWTIVSG